VPATKKAKVGALRFGGPASSWQSTKRTQLGLGSSTLSAIANVKGMSAMALNVALLTSHRSMPNLVLDAQERADIIAFILTLKAN
jgi:hypothetical protein